MQAQLLRRSRAAGGNRGRAKLERHRSSGSRKYLLRGLVRCGFGGRRIGQRPDERALSDAEVNAMIDSLGDVGAALTDADPEKLSRLYESLGLSLKYEPHARIVEATITPRVVSARVRGGT